MAYDSDRRRAFEQFCREQPNIDYIPQALSRGLAFDWRCVGRRPVRMGKAGVFDRQGYVVGAWTVWRR